MSEHLMIIHPGFFSLFRRGLKSVECRLSRTRRPPFGHVAPGDRIWIKLSGGPVVAHAQARRVNYIHPLTLSDLASVLATYGPDIGAGPGFFRSRRHARYATVIQLGLVRCVRPFRIKKRDRRSWVVLTKPLAAPSCPPAVGPQALNQRRKILSGQSGS